MLVEFIYVFVWHIDGKDVWEYDKDFEYGDF